MGVVHNNFLAELTRGAQRAMPEAALAEARRIVELVRERRRAKLAAEAPTVAPTSTLAIGADVAFSMVLIPDGEGDEGGADGRGGGDGGGGGAGAGGGGGGGDGGRGGGGPVEPPSLDPLRRGFDAPLAPSPPAPSFDHLPRGFDATLSRAHVTYEGVALAIDALHVAKREEGPAGDTFAIGGHRLLLDLGANRGAQDGAKRGGPNPPVPKQLEHLVSTPEHPRIPLEYRMGSAWAPSEPSLSIPRGSSRSGWPPSSAPRSPPLPLLIHSPPSSQPAPRRIHSLPPSHSQVATFQAFTQPSPEPAEAEPPRPLHIHFRQERLGVQIGRQEDSSLTFHDVELGLRLDELRCDIATWSPA